MFCRVKAPFSVPICEIFCWNIKKFHTLIVAETFPSILEGTFHLRSCRIFQCTDESAELYLMTDLDKEVKHKQTIFATNRVTNHVFTIF